MSTENGLSLDLEVQLQLGSTVKVTPATLHLPDKLIHQKWTVIGQLTLQPCLSSPCLCLIGVGQKSYYRLDLCMENPYDLLQELQKGNHRPLRLMAISNDVSETNQFRLLAIMRSSISAWVRLAPAQLEAVVEILSPESSMVAVASSALPPLASSSSHCMLAEALPASREDILEEDDSDFLESIIRSGAIDDLKILLKHKTQDTLKALEAEPKRDLIIQCGNADILKAVIKATSPSSLVRILLCVSAVKANNLIMAEMLVPNTLFVTIAGKHYKFMNYYLMRNRNMAMVELLFASSYRQNYLGQTTHLPSITAHSKLEDLEADLAFLEVAIERDSNIKSLKEDLENIIRDNLWNKHAWTDRALYPKVSAAWQRDLFNTRFIFVGRCTRPDYALSMVNLLRSSHSEKTAIHFFNLIPVTDYEQVNFPELLSECILRNLRGLFEHLLTAALANQQQILTLAILRYVVTKASYKVAQRAAPYVRILEDRLGQVDFNAAILNGRELLFVYNEALGHLLWDLMLELGREPLYKEFLTEIIRTQSVCAIIHIRDKIKAQGLYHTIDLRQMNFVCGSYKMPDLDDLQWDCVPSNCLI